MSKGRALLIALIAAGAMVAGGAVAASAARGATGTTFLAAASPTPTFKSNEVSAHEAGASAAREAAENNGTFRPGDGGGPRTCSNQSSAHEANESAAQEAAEPKAACPSAAPSQ